MKRAENKSPEGPIDRRELMRRAVYMVGGAAALAGLEGCSGAEGNVQPQTRGSAGRYFSAIRMDQLRAVIDVMIPATDTPGAIAAGVPEFMDDMMSDWASAETRSQMKAVLDQIGERAIRVGGQSFRRLSPEHQLAVLEGYDAHSFEVWNADYQRFKDLVLLGYYHSEIGATQELRFELIPGRWDACVPLGDMRTWAD